MTTDSNIENSPRQVAHGTLDIESRKSPIVDDSAASQIDNSNLTIAKSRKGIGGPKTEDGKRKSSMNALKHGIYATTEEGIAALEETTGCSYAETLDRMRHYYKPMNPLEDVLVRRIARSAWRMIVTEAAENRVLSLCANQPRISNRHHGIINTERFIDVHLHRAVRALQLKRDREHERSGNELRSPRLHEGTSS